MAALGVLLLLLLGLASGGLSQSLEPGRVFREAPSAYAESEDGASANITWPSGMTYSGHVQNQGKEEKRRRRRTGGIGRQ